MFPILKSTMTNSKYLKYMGFLFVHLFILKHEMIKTLPISDKIIKIFFWCWFYRSDLILHTRASIHFIHFNVEFIECNIKVWLLNETKKTTSFFCNDEIIKLLWSWGCVLVKCRIEGLHIKCQQWFVLVVLDHQRRRDVGVWKKFAASSWNLANALYDAICRSMSMPTVHPELCR